MEPKKDYKKACFELFIILAMGAIIIGIYEMAQSARNSGKPKHSVTASK